MSVASAEFATFARMAPSVAARLTRKQCKNFVDDRHMCAFREQDHVTVDDELLLSRGLLEMRDGKLSLTPLGGFVVDVAAQRLLRPEYEATSWSSM